VAALASSANAADNYAPYHTCKQVLQNYDAPQGSKANRVWREELSWLLGFVEGAGVVGNFNPDDILKLDGGPVQMMLWTCRQYPDGKLWNAANAVVGYALDRQKERAAK